MASAEISLSPALGDGESGMSPGEFVLKKVFSEFVAVSDRRLQHIATQSLDHPLSKSLQRGEDPHFDQLMNALNEVASFCLRSILTSVFKWRDMQIQQCRSNTSWSTVPSGDATDSPYPASKREKEYLMERQELAIEFVFCLVLIEVLTKLSVHPVPESFIHTIEDFAFKNFKQQETLKERPAMNPNIQNMKKVADLYAEVVGVLSQARFHSVRRRFFQEIRNPQHNSATTISIIEGMTFVRVKMFPAEEIEQWFAFLQECANYFLDCSREKIKQAMAALLVEILLPVAGVIKVDLESSLPAVKKFVNMLYAHSFDQVKRKHSSACAYIPLVTVLLSIAEQQFFLNYWGIFLTQIILPNIRRGDSKIQRIALEALYRLVWVYMVRIHGESNMSTFNRLRLIVETLFPRGQRGVQPKDMPLNIFVKLIHFIARERMEHAMTEIVLDLLSLGRSKTNINPERMIIGLRVFLLIADSLEKKEGDPPMPLNAGLLPSGGPPRVKTKFLSTTLTDETAKKIGIAPFYPPVRRALHGILHALDQSIGRTLACTIPQVSGRSVEELLSGVKPKLDLLKTCVAAIPRIMPEGMTREDLLLLLSRLSIHIDHELVKTTFNSLQNIITNFPSWRHDVARVFAQFILQDIPDSCPLVLEAALKMLIQMITHWRALIATEADKQNTTVSVSDGVLCCVPWVEACALVMLCSYRSVSRRISLLLLKEVRSLHEALQLQMEESTVMDMIERATPTIIKRYLATLSVKERTELRLGSLNITWLADRSTCFLEQGGSRENLRDAWTQCLAGLLEPHVLPDACPTSLHIAWPYAFHRMVKAYAVLDPGGVAHDKGDKPPSLKGRRPVISSIEMFLWRNYLIFTSCTAPPSTSAQTSFISTDSIGLDSSGRFQQQLNARDLFHKVVPLIRTDGEIREVAITALGLVNPHAFGDLVEELQSHIHDALDQRKGDNPRKKRRRETLRVQITRVFALTAEHGCFRQSPMARTERGEVSPIFLEFIDGIKSHLEQEMGYPQDLRLHFSHLISSIVNSLPRGVARLRLFSPEMRYTLFNLFSNWCGLYGTQATEANQQTRPHKSALSFNALQAMSALLCCGPVFHPRGLDKESSLYDWLENMLGSGEPRVQTLGRKTVQMLLQNNSTSPTLLSWVIDHCYESKASCAQLCFHALSNTLAAMPTYPCDVVKVLHVVLYKTADKELSTRERATHLLQILDRRFFASGENGGGRPVLLGCLTGGAYSELHVDISKELAFANPELTLPLFCEMVYRFEMTPRSDQRSILQYMEPWLHNVELLDYSPHPHLINQCDFREETTPPESTNPVLSGSGWGSVDGTTVVLHNLLYITAKYGDSHLKEVESLWCALCTWPQNIRTTLNYFAHLTCVSGNMNLMLQQAKRVMVCFSRNQAMTIVSELMRDLQSVEMISTEVQIQDTPPFYRLITPSQSRAREVGAVTVETRTGDGVEGEGWAVAWRMSVRLHEGQAIPLPLPPDKQHYASMRELLKAPTRQLAPLHRCNFALILLSELVIELQEVDWSPHLPLLLHVVLLGLDIFRPIVYEHAKRLLGNLVVVLACRDDKMAALQARFSQQEASLRSPSTSSLSSEGEGKLEPSSSMDSLVEACPYQNCLSDEARELIQFVSTRDTHRPPWPFADLSNKLNPSSEVQELSTLVGKVLSVFHHVPSEPLKENWAKIALQWATSCSSRQYASQSFQVCRALELPLSSHMFREVLTRLAESACDQGEEQSYVLEIILTLESAINHLDKEVLQPSNVYTNESPRKVSDLPPLPSDLPDGSSPLPLSPLSPPPSAESGAGVRRRHTRVRSVTSRAEMMSRPSSARARVEVHQPQDHSSSPLPISPTPSHHSHISHEMQMRSPMHTKAATFDAIGNNSTDGPLTGNRPHSMYTAPHTHEGAGGWTGWGEEGGGGGKPIPIPSHPSRDITKEGTKFSTSPGQAQDSSALSATAVEPKQVEPKQVNHKPKESALPTNESRSRKVSEPPPSLLVLFDRDMASSRRAMKQQKSVDEIHLKQSSFDSSHLQTIQGSPKHMRRIKSPSLFEKNPTTAKAGTSSSSSKTKEPSGMHRAPSHPHLNSATSSPQVTHVYGLPPAGQPLVKARSIQQLRMDSDEDDSVSIRRSNSASSGKADMGNNSLRREAMKQSRSKENLMREEMSLRKTPSKESILVKDAGGGGGVSVSKERTAPSKDMQTGAAISVETTQAPLIGSQRGSPSKLHADVRRRNSSQPWGRKDQEGLYGHRHTRPKSMIETSSFRHGAQYSFDLKPAPPNLLTQMFWTSVSLLESDFEREFMMALRLLSKVLDRVDLSLSDTYDCLEELLSKLKWPNFPGVQALLLKGLTLEAVSEPTRTLLSRITVYASSPIFDPSQYAGLPLNIIALMPVLVYHFDSPTEFCLKVVANIQRACTTVELPSEESKTKLVYMTKMFQMYSTRDFTNGCDLWLAGICRYLNDAYAPIASKVLSLLTEMLEKGCSQYHRPVLKLLYEYLKLQDPKSREMRELGESIMTVVSQHIKGHLWKEALDLLKLVVSNSASLVQPPTRGLPIVDLGLFNQTLPGPTLQFSVDLQPGSHDLSLAQEHIVVSSWKKPQGSHRRTRERLLSVLNACVPVPVLMSSPSVVFTDEQALMAEKSTLYSASTSEATGSITSIGGEVMESSQPESQVLISAVGQEFNFLDEFEYKYDSSSESETPGPFSRSFQALDTEYKEESSPGSPLSLSLGGSTELLPGAMEGEEEEEEEDEEEEEEEQEEYTPSPLPEDVLEGQSPEPEDLPTTEESSSPVRVSSPDPHLSSYGVSPTDHSPESSKKPPETFSLDFSGRIDEEPPDTIEDESGDTGPIEIVLPDENESLENKLPNSSGDSPEPPQESQLPENESHNEQGEAIERVSEFPVVGAEEPLLVRTEQPSGLDDSSEKPPDLQIFDSAQDHSHKHEASEELGEPPPTQVEEGERLSEEENEEEEEEKEEEEEGGGKEEEVGEEEEAQGVGGGERSGSQQQRQQEDSRPGKEDVEEEEVESPLGGMAKVINYEMMELVDIASPHPKLPEVSRFLNIAADKIEQTWRSHVSQLGHHRSSNIAVHTHFIFRRLFAAVCKQLSSLTQEACRYIGNGYRSFAAHFTVTVEELLSQFELPKVFVDAALLSRSGLLDRHISLVLEIHDHLASYLHERTTVMECLSHFKFALRQQSPIGTIPSSPLTPPPSLLPLSIDEAALQLCRAVHQLHFQLLVLLGCYIKLLGTLKAEIERSGMADLCRVLTEMNVVICEAVVAVSRGPSPPLDDHSEREVGGMGCVAEAVQALEDALQRRDCLRAVQLLHALRKHWKNEEVFGSNEGDDIDCLFFIFARSLTDGEEGTLCMTHTENELSDVHERLLTQNVSLHALLDRSHDQDTPTRRLEEEVLESKLTFEDYRT